MNPPTPPHTPKATKPSRRSKEFKNANHKPLTIKDSRYGIRPKSSYEEPTIATYSNPGRGASGEHQN